MRLRPPVFSVRGLEACLSSLTTWGLAATFRKKVGELTFFSTGKVTHVMLQCLRFYSLFGMLNFVCFVVVVVVVFF